MQRCYAIALFVALLCGGPAGCSDDERADEADEAERPLQPLVYTEDPDHSPEAAAAQERRLMRRLLEGASPDGGTWGTMQSESNRDVAPATSPDQLGQFAYRALIERHDPSWDAAFVSPSNYAALVDVSLEKARKFVDRRQGEAVGTRRAFAIEKRSEAPEEGLSSIFAYEQLKLGEGRTLDGDVADEDETVTQYWDNRLRMRLRDGDVEFEIRIPKILRIPSGRANRKAGAVRQIGIASDLHIGARLRIFLETGMHLKPALLRSFEYPVPLAVGNYWRYSRAVTGEDSSGEQPGGEKMGASDGANSGGVRAPGALEATRVTLKVRSVDRYGTRRLVQFRWSYNDADLTQVDEYWLATPRRIYLCPRPCRRHVDDLSWLLSYLRRQTAIFRFPLARGESWGGAGDDVFSVGAKWKQLELPAGSFFGTFAIRGAGPLRDRVPFDRIGGLTRFVAPGAGVVRRRYPLAGGDTVIVESLADYRLMTR